MDIVTPRPHIFLYTDDAQITDEVRGRMIEAGYLPVRVANVDSVRILSAPISIESDDMSAITRAALISVNTYASAREEFGKHLCMLLLRKTP